MAEDWDPSEAIVICTRNRPGELRHTLTGIEDHPPSGDAALVVIDASDPEARTENHEAVDSVQAIPSVHWPYVELPSLPSQRDYALDRLPSSVKIVHFIDDDVTVHAGYFDTLTRTLHAHPEVDAVGGRLHQPKALSSSPNSTEWLNGCSSYRRHISQRHRFTPSTDGYALLEDLEVSYCVGQHTALLVVPEATLTHRVSAQNRHNLSAYVYTAMVHRYWLVTPH